MKLLRGLHNPGLSGEGCVATIGNFDGVHRGHQKVLEKTLVKSRASGLPSLVIVFEPQAQEYFHPETAPSRLMNFRQKFDAIRSMGVDFLFCLRFNEALRSLTADAFVERILCEHLSIKHLVVGDDFRFGGDRLGDFEFLVNSGEQLGFTAENTQTQYGANRAGDEARISSTRIRELLASGEFKAAESLLGRAYKLSGRVMHGQALGRTLGFRTANIALKRKRCALNGVYCVRAVLPDGQRVNGVANVGRKPSAGQFDPNLEAHLLDFSGDLYGQYLEVEFLHKLRDEVKFDGLESLTKQIAKDIESARTFFG